MLFILLMVVSAVVVSTESCTGNKTTETDSIPDTTAFDTTTIDTMESIIEEQPMPKAADELFDDFFFNFAGNRKLQVKRIHFPLPIYNEGKVENRLTKSQWKVDHFFMEQEYYTLIFDNKRQMQVVKDTAVHHVVVEKIDLDAKSIKKYNFERIDGLWILTKISHEPTHSGKNASFLEFYHKFSTDSIFQVASMDEIVTFSAPDPDDDFSNITGSIVPEQWPMFKPTFIPKGIIYNIMYGQQYKESTKKIFLVRGIANSLEMEMDFRKEGDSWKLTSFSY